jgi:hypothetical protein
MAGWDYYVYNLNSGADPKQLLNTLEKLGKHSWELVAVDQGIMYFKRYENYEAQLRVGVAAENENDEPLLAWKANPAAGEKRISSVTTQDAGPDGVPHSHRVVAIVDGENVVMKGSTDMVDDHVHPVSLLGVVEEAAGHTHLFSVV